MKKQAKLAVITGDLVSSTALAEKDMSARMATVERAAAELADWGSPTYFTRQSGDGWQMVIRPPELALRAALFIRSHLMRDGAARVTRMYIAAGNAELHSENLNDATDPVFVASGRGLKSLPKRALMGHADKGALGATTRLLDHISQNWTPAQAKLMSDALLPQNLSQKEIAKRHDISQQSVQQSLSAAGFPAVEDALRFLEAND